MKAETCLATLPGATDSERLVVVLAPAAGGSTRIALRQQTWAEGIGWYDQTSLELAPEQVHQLRAVLGVTGGRAVPRPRPRDDRDQPATLAFPGVLRVESA